jgi:hypothetical protein
LIAFKTPGFERLYSGVTNKMASDLPMASVKAIASGG